MSESDATIEPDDSIGGSGFTIEVLSEYLDRGRLPANPTIDNNAECQAMLASLERLGGLSRELVAQDAAQNPTLDEGWLSSLLSTISLEVRSGRDIPLTTPSPSTTLSITEGAVRELVRAAGDSVDGVLVGRCSLEGEVGEIGSSIRIALTISVVISAPVVVLAQQVRERVYSELLKHTQLAIEAIDVTVTDVHELAQPIRSEESE